MDKQKDFYQLENEIQDIYRQIQILTENDDKAAAVEIKKGRAAIAQKWEKLAPVLTPLHYVQIARHPQRPYTLDYLNALVDDFVEFHGDRRAGDDTAIVAGFGFYKGKTTAFIGHQKGRTTRNRIMRNFGQPNPEGYRKALRVMKLAEKFGYPVVTLIDTPGAYPGIQAEERGQAEAIAFNLKEIANLRVPVINIVIGEGGSGGALAIGVGDELIMLQYSFYSVISPEGCAAILWNDQDAMSQVTENLHFLPEDLKKFNIVDTIISEPAGGAHVDWNTTFLHVDKVLAEALDRLRKKDVNKLLDDRYGKYRNIGIYKTE